VLQRAAAAHTHAQTDWVNNDDNYELMNVM
jgi:hypothetical protein